MSLDWSKLKEYKCPICSDELKEKQERHSCVSCNFSISHEKLSNMVVLRHKPLDPPEFIKEIREKEKPQSRIKLWINKLIS